LKNLHSWPIISFAFMPFISPLSKWKIKINIFQENYVVYFLTHMQITSTNCWWCYMNDSICIIGYYWSRSLSYSNIFFALKNEELYIVFHEKETYVPFDYSWHCIWIIFRWNSWSFNRRLLNFISNRFNWISCKWRH
jgi:hypothetical protein